MSDIGIGKLITGPAEKDAIHVAVFPAKALQDLQPGWRVAMLDAKAGLVRFCDDNKAIGIVDPFLTKPIEPGQQFWVFLFPGSITSLRHDWTHPALNDTSESREWIEQFAERLDVEYGDLLDGAANWIRNSNYFYGGSNLEGEYVPDEFWFHYERVTNTVVHPDDRQSFFRCSC